MTSIVLGATAGLGRSLSVALAEQGENLILLATDQRDLAALKSHLSIIFGIEVDTIVCDASDIEQLTKTLTAATDNTDHLSALYIPMGTSSDHDLWDQSFSLSEQLSRINYLSVVASVSLVLPHLVNKSGARIVGFGSIATIRSRRRNIAYTAAKSALGSYFQSLRHALTDKPVTVQFYQMGFIQSQQYYGRQSPFPPICPDRAADIIVADQNRDFGSRFLPAYWTFIAFILRALPWSIFRRMEF